MLTAAILVAAGPGTRLRASQAKAFVPLAGLPLFIYSLRALQACDAISHVVVVVPSARKAEAEDVSRSGGPWRFELSFAQGGRERQDSVRAGLAQVGNADLIAIHDAARPFLSPRLINEVVTAAAKHGAALPAVAPTDTVKLRDDQGFVGSTVPRQRVWLAQTPQIFRADWIRHAHEEARTTGAEATDDAMLVEQLGLRVHLVPGDPTNRKITTPDDLEWAEWWLAKHPAPR